MKKKKYILRKKPCSKCGGKYNYSDRSCVSCSKRTSSTHYEAKLAMENKSRIIFHRQKALKEGQIIYVSNNRCKCCGNIERYTSNGGCVHCQKQKSTENWQNFVIERDLKAPSALQEPTKQLFFQMMMDSEEKQHWREEALKLYPRERELIEKIFKRELDEQLMPKYLELKKAMDFTTSFEFMAYKQAKRNYDKATENPFYQIGLLIAEHNLSRQTKYQEHPDFPKQFYEFNPDVHDAEFLFELLTLENKIKLDC